jgi:hypothetical protein
MRAGTNYYTRREAVALMKARYEGSLGIDHLLRVAVDAT